MTIDPGISGTGWAVWSREWKLKSFGISTCSNGEWKEKMEEIGIQLNEVIKKHRVSCAHIEEPRKFQGVFGNMVADKGDLVKLSIFVGFLTGYLNVRAVGYVPVIVWKGTLSKKIVEERVKKIFPNLNVKSHAIDAIGIGLYLRGQKEFQ